LLIIPFDQHGETVGTKASRVHPIVVSSTDADLQAIAFYTRLIGSESSLD
jgi:hypothetical protein